MKNKIAKILGVVLTLATLTSLFVFAAPVAAGTQSWSKISLPTAAPNNVLGTATVLGPIAQAKDGSVIFMAAGGAYTQLLYKSTDFGRTWASVAAFPGNPDYTGQVFDIVFGSDANTVYVTDSLNIFKTINGGSTWTTIAGLFNSTLVNPAGWITSLSIGYLGTAPYIFASTSTFGGGGGGAFVCSEAVYGSPWADMNVGTDRPENTSASLDVAQILVMPDFATTQGVFVLWTDISNGMTRLSAKYAGAQWDATANDVRLTYSVGTTPTNFSAPMLSGDIFLPSDFSSNPASGLMQAYVGVDTMDLSTPNGPSDVYLAYFGPAASGIESPSFDLNIGGTDTSSHVSCLSGVGTAAGASLVASGFVPAAPSVPVVWTTRNGGQTWTSTAATLNTKGPTGGASPLFAPFALSVAQMSYTAPGSAWDGRALVATHGPDNGVSLTTDFGMTFNQISFVDFAITNLVNISLASDNTIYATTNNGGPDFYSVWRGVPTGSAGAYVWDRVLSYTQLPGNPDFDFVSTLPDNSAVFVADAASGSIWRSLDKGQTWKLQLSTNPAGAFTSWLVVNANTILIGAGANVYQTTTNGVVWFTRAVFTGGSTTSIAVASNGDYLAANVLAGVVRLAKSSDGGLTWTAFAATVGTTATSAVITPASTYAASGRVYVAMTGNAGVYYLTAAGASPTRADNSASFAQIATNGTGIVASAGGPGNSSEGTGMIYATDSSAATNGVVRLRGTEKFGERLSSGSGITLTGLWLGTNSVGSVALYSISGSAIYTYTDTLNLAGAGVAVSAVTSTSALVSFTALANATAYVVAVNTTAQTSVFTAATSAGVLVTPVTTTGATWSASVTGLTATTPYFVSVWAVAPVSSFMFGGASTFTTLPTMPQPVILGLIPAPGAQNVQPLVNFQWQAVTGATSYELWLDTKVDFSTAQKYTAIPAPAGGALNVDWAPPAALLNNTLYYWQVRAVTSAGVSVWNGVWSFTTAPVATPPVTVTTAPQATIVFPTPQPPVTITVNPPAPTPVLTVTQPIITLTTPPAGPTPTYIWIIVAVGAVLTIAVIVLIIRTRRVV